MKGDSEVLLSFLRRTFYYHDLKIDFNIIFYKLAGFQTPRLL
jgi:hypothetical protein